MNDTSEMNLRHYIYIKASLRRFKKMQKQIMLMRNNQFTANSDSIYTP